jgi:hypothetical protein
VQNAAKRGLSGQKGQQMRGTWIAQKNNFKLLQRLKCDEETGKTGLSDIVAAGD